VPIPDAVSVSDDKRLTAMKLDALAEFAAGAGHEINNPVGTIVGHVQQLLAGETDPDRRHALATIGAQAYRIRDMIGDVMLFARPPQPRREPLELCAVVADVVSQFRAEALLAGIAIPVDAAGPVPIFADKTQIQIAISGLLRNSIESLPAGGTVTVQIRSIGTPQPEWGCLSIQDDGPGLSPEAREHLFDPFFSGRQAGRGLGFGLPKVWRIVTLHGGRIEVVTPATGGVIFTVFWPATG
jgi:signal transduction histidine kinase